ncbi:hypothetical protein [Chimaeribacter arupi]|uniref:hypothetical protein n=1 Tax=Chimaeribacter arupi TaxID=2060066 RepID=UPI000C7D41DC|nr:hypothetical protein [Chimaeribacter arupi]PLR30108.1 hypothetical protein CYR23_18460 [Chimaeribacter arupi]
MINRALIIALTLTSSGLGAVEKNPCIVPHASIGIGMVNAMEQDMGIDARILQEDKTSAELIDNTKMTEILAEQFAVNEARREGKGWLSAEEYKKIYYNDNTRNLIVKYNYENNMGKHNVFLTSALVNDNECSVRFNGYIIVKREF